MIKLSVNETKWSSLLARTCTLILYISIWIFDFGPVKLPGLSRNGPLVPERPNPGLKFCFVFVLTGFLCIAESNILCYNYRILEWIKAQQYFASSSCMLLGKKTLTKISLNPGLNLTIFRATVSWDKKLTTVFFRL